MPSFLLNYHKEYEDEVEVDFEVFCAKCGAGLCNQSEGGNTNGRKTPYVSVEPCENCLEAVKDGGYYKGYAEGYDEGLNKTSEEYDAGYTAGFTEGLKGN